MTNNRKFFVMQNIIWDTEAIEKLYCLSFFELLFKAAEIHRQYFPGNEIELNTLLNIKTGACPEDCAYCPQSGRYNTGLKKEKLMSLEKIVEKARQAKESGACRFCMGAAWRSPPASAMPQLAEIIKSVKALGLQVCMTLGMLKRAEAEELKSAGLDFYNHNLDSSPEYYQKIITTRTYQERLDTLENVRKSGIKVCCGGIIGMGESRIDRIGLLKQLANLSQPPESVPINRLIPVKGTPLENTAQMDNFEFIRTIAIARIIMPASRVRLSAGRESMSEEMQALCFMAGANSIHFGEKLLVTGNPAKSQDIQMLKKLGLKIKQPQEKDIYVNK
jgi:biotin synthase